MTVEKRPWCIISTPHDPPHNSMVELAIGHNALGRFVRPSGLARVATADAGAVRRAAQGDTRGAEPGVGPTWTRVFVRAPVGPLRLADCLLAAQTGWLFPLALAGVLVGALGVAAQRPVAPTHLR